MWTPKVGPCSSVTVGEGAEKGDDLFLSPGFYKLWLGEEKEGKECSSNKYSEYWYMFPQEDNFQAKGFEGRGRG